MAPAEEARLFLASAPASVQAEYQRIATRIEAVLSPEELGLWLDHALQLSRGAGVSTQAAVEYLKASAVLVERWPVPFVERWAATGMRLAQASPQVAAAYFRSSPAVLAHLRAGEIEQWGATCARMMLDGPPATGARWQAGALAAQLFEVSPDLLRYLDLAELGMLAEVLEQVAEAWHPAARQCLALAVDLLPGLPSPERRRTLAVASLLARRSPGDVKDWFAKAGFVLGGLDPTSKVPLLALAAGLAKEGSDAGAVLAFLKTSGDRLGPMQGDQSRFLGFAGRIADVSAHAAEDFLRSSPTLAGRVEGDRLESWVREGMAALKDGEASGRAYFKLESSRSVAQLRELSPAVELSSVAELLRLFCTALTGEEMQVQPTSHLVQRGIGWTAEQRPTTEGNAIFLPDVIQAHETHRENFDRLKVYAVHQAGHLEFGSFRFQFDKPSALFPDSRADLAARNVIARPDEDADAGADPHPGPLPGGRGDLTTDLERFFGLFPHRRLAQDLFTLAEDARIDARIHHEYPGIRRPLARAQHAERDDRPGMGGLSPRAALMEALLQKTLAPHAELALPGPMLKYFEGAWSCMEPLFQAEARVEDAAEATIRLYLIVSNLPLGRGEAGSMGGPGIPTEDDEDLEELMNLRSSMGHAISDLFNNMDALDEEGYEPMTPVEYRGDFKPQLVQAMMKLREREGPKGPTTEAPVSIDELQKMLENLNEIEISELSESELGATTGMFVTNLLRETGRAMEEAENTGSALHGHAPQPDGPLTRKGPDEYLYPEWDFRAGTYRPDWCLVKERTLESGSAEYYDSVLARHGSLAKAVRRQFQALRPEVFKKLKHLIDGEEYDLDAVIDWAVDRRSHIPPSEKLYWRRNKIERNVAVALLLDVSASTDEDAKKESKPVEDWGSDWDNDSDRFLLVLRERLRQQEAARRSRRRIIDVERESAVLLVQALEALGDSYGVYGFSGYGRDGVEVFVVKELGEAFGETVKARVGNLEPVRGTRMGAAIRHVTTKLDARDARTKLLLLVSDGRPQDHDYGRDRTERDYALHDTRKALLEAKQKRIVPFALTVDREGHDYLKTICAGIGYEVVDDIEALPSRLPAIYRELAF